MQGKRMGFSFDPFIFSTFYEITELARRCFGAPKGPFYGRRVHFSKELLLIYHMLSTESTLFCNFSFSNCELVYSAPCPGSLFPAFGQFVQFDIFSRFSLGRMSETRRFFPSLPARASATLVSLFSILRRRAVFDTVALATVPLDSCILQESAPPPASFSPYVQKWSVGVPRSDFFTGVSAGILSAHRSRHGETGRCPPRAC